MKKQIKTPTKNPADNKADNFREHPRPTGSGTSEALPVTTGESERLPKISALLEPIDFTPGIIVLVPTETVYGYAVKLSDLKAIENLMKYKERDYDSGKVFTLVPESKMTIKKYATITEVAKPLIEKYIPGEITLILPKNPNFNHPYFDHFETIGIRIPDHELFEKILPQTGPLLLTSANKKGSTPKSATGHKPSTIVDCTTNQVKVIRQGEIVI